MTQRILLLSLLSVFVAVPASAQEDDPFADPVEGTGDEPKEGFEGPVDDPLGDTYDDPNQADAITADRFEEKVEKKTPVVFDKDSYPSEEALRPLTLPEGLFEVSLDAPFVLSDPAILWQTLRAGYGITNEIQAGLTYSFGLVNLDPPPGANGFEAGKAFSLDGGYLVIPGWVSVTLSIPFYVDPFAVGVIVGAPVRVAFSDKWVLFAGENLLQITIKDFPVDAADPASNLVWAAAAQTPGGFNPPDGNLNLNLKALYQANPNLAVFLTFGYYMIDFKQDDPPVPLFLGVSYTSQGKLDLGARAGFMRFDDASDTFSFAAFAAYRL